jgi:mono/diheme cytochrome c family protein
MDIATVTLILLLAGGACTVLALYFTTRKPRPAITPMLWVVGLGVLAANLWLLFAPTGEQATLPTNPIPLNAESIAQGQLLYVENCLRCHGENLDSTGPEAASLTVPPANLREHFPFHEDGFHFNLITNGAGGMPALATQIAEGDRWHIINYLRDATRTDADGEHGGGVEHNHEEHGNHDH